MHEFASGWIDDVVFVEQYKQYTSVKKLAVSNGLPLTHTQDICNHDAT